MAEPNSPKAPFKKSPHEGGRRSSLPSDTSHTSGVPGSINAGLLKGRKPAFPKRGS